jgi:hypothetical protein
VKYESVFHILARWERDISDTSEIICRGLPFRLMAGTGKLGKKLTNNFIILCELAYALGADGVTQS